MCHWFSATRRWVGATRRAVGLGTGALMRHDTAGPPARASYFIYCTYRWVGAMRRWVRRYAPSTTESVMRYAHMLLRRSTYERTPETRAHYHECRRHVAPILVLEEDQPQLAVEPTPREQRSPA